MRRTTIALFAFALLLAPAAAVAQDTPGTVVEVFPAGPAAGAKLRVNNDGSTDVIGGLAGFTRAGLPAPGAPGRRLRVTDECNREVVDTGREWSNVSDVINVQQCGASGARLSSGIETTTTTTSGATSSGATTVAVASGASFDNGETVKITGAGPSGAVYRGVITAGGGTTSWTVYPAVNTAVSSGATVTHGDNNVTTLVTAPASSGATSVTVASASTFKAGHGIYVAGGGAASGGGFLPHVATIAGVSGSTITFTPGLTSAVSANALVMHDDTAAIQTALNLAGTKRALTVYFPAGTYMTNRPDRTGTGGLAGTLLLPEPPCCTDQTVGLDLVGDARPPALSPSFNNHEVSTGGSIIQTDTAGHALLTGKSPVSGNSYGFLMMNLRIRNLHFRLYDNPQKRGLDLAWVNIAHLDSFGIDTGTPTNRVTQPTNSSAVGLYMPGPLNSAGVARDGYIYGFYKGVVTGEHGDLSDVLTQYNRVGFEFPAADYPVRVGQIVSNQNASHFKVTGAVQFAGEGLLKAERRWPSSAAPAWTASTYDLEDPSSLGRGKLAIFSWDPGTNTSQVPILSGANNLRVRPVGGAEVGEGQGFSDTFGAAALDTSRWGVGSAFFASDGSASGAVSQAGGLLQISPEASVAAGRYRGVVTQQYFNFLPGKTAAVKVAQVGTNGADTILIVAADTNNYYGITQTGTFLIFSGKGGGASATIATVTYNSTNHRWWRLRFAAGVMHAEVSADGSSWTVLGSAVGASALFSPSRVRVSLEAGVGSSIASPGTAQFDDLTISAP